MKDWRIRRRYGYGVAQLRLPAPPPRGRELGLARGIVDALRELSAEDLRSFALKLGTGVVVLVALSFAIWDSRWVAQLEPESFEPTRMEWFAQAPPPVESPPIVEPPLPFAEPQPRMAPVRQPDRKPVQMARVVVAETPRIRIAEKPKRLREQPRPRVAEIEPVLRPEPLVTTPLRKRGRFQQLRPTRGAPRPIASNPAFPSADSPSRAQTQPQRPPLDSRRVAMTRVASIPAFPTAAPVGVDAPITTPVSPFARGFSAAESTLPSVAAAPLSFPAAPAGSAVETAEVSRAVRGSERPSNLLMASVSSASGDVDGVALSSLPSCRSDAEEETLKQQVLATVEVQVECNSHAGTWMFLQTRNLNAFLMNVKRNPGRPQGNRCDELRLALGCIAGGM